MSFSGSWFYCSRRKRGLRGEEETTLESIGLAESAARAKFRLRKKHMNLCACESVEREHGVDVSVNATVMSETFH